MQESTCEVFITSHSEVFVHIRCKQLWSNEASLSSTRFYNTSGPDTLLMMTAGVANVSSANTEGHEY